LETRTFTLILIGRAMPRHFPLGDAEYGSGKVVGTSLVPVGRIWVR
jgi:hypothetical protein